MWADELVGGGLPSSSASLVMDVQPTDLPNIKYYLQVRFVYIF